MSSDSLTDAYTRAHGQGTCPCGDAPGLAARLQQAMSRSEAKWPKIALSGEAFALALGRVTAKDCPESPLEQLFFEDLFLVTACLAKDHAALVLLEREYAPRIGAWCSRLGVASGEVSEVEQATRTRLLVGDKDSPPKLLAYSARGPLHAFIRAVVANWIVSEKRKERPMVPIGDSGIAERAVVHDPALATVRAQYAECFRVAIRAALEALPTRDRTLLRLVYVDGVSVERVALTYGVHRVSASRWLSHARHSLLEGTKSRMGTLTRLTHSEVESVARMCLSMVDLSLERVLASHHEPT